ncbi:MAG TPA: YdcF family protein [Candidatus Saccharimonadales bacterium]|nr:YdcF family protein [Candidatus Saccharimonadales bacterium]
MGSTSLTEKLISAEEQPYAGQPHLPALPADAVVALGGDEHLSHNDLLGFAMGEGGSRVLTAVELVRLGKARTLVLGGSSPIPGRPDAPSMGVLQDWVTSWGLTAGSVTNLGICINTHDEAVAFRALARRQGWLKVILVTSALHMRRSVALFKTQGIDVTPVAADFKAAGVSPPLPLSPFPRERRLFLMTLYMHEKIGWWVYRARGWV